MIELIESIKARLKATPLPIRQVAKRADVNYNWLIAFHRGDTSGMSAKGLAHAEKLMRFFEETQ